MNAARTSYSLKWKSLPARSYRVQSSPNLQQWTNELTGIPSGLSLIETSLTRSQSASDVRFYRVREE